MEKVVLIVDEEPLIISRLKRLLERRGFSVVSAERAEQALVKLATRKIDLVMVDFGLSGINGAELLERVKRFYPQVKRVLMTSGVPSPAIKKAVKNSTAQAVIEKPWEEDELLEVVENLLSEKGE